MPTAQSCWASTKSRVPLDNFVYAKRGEKKSNVIGVETLRQPYELGGLKLIVVKSTLESISLMRLKAYLSPAPERPQWASIANRILAKCAIARYKNIEPVFLVNTFLQQWRVYEMAKALPLTLRQMIHAGEKYGARLIAFRMSPKIQSQLPYWYHIGTKPSLVSVYNDKWGKCQRCNHRISSVGDMLNHANKNRNSDCCERINCRCVNCRNDRALGCEHPPKCRRNADKKLQNLEPQWDPRRATPAPEDHVYTIQETSNGWIPATLRIPDNRHPLSLIRIFTNRSNPPAPAIIPLKARSSTTIAHPAELKPNPTIWTDGSCSLNGTADARAGSGLWYGENSSWNLATRASGEVQSNNTGEINAAIVATQRHHDAEVIRIISDSTYTIDAMTILAQKRLDHGFDGVANALQLATLTAEILTTNAKILVKKVKGHSGDVGNDGADELAAQGANKPTVDAIDTAMGSVLMKVGADLNTATQASLYAHVRRYRPPPVRETTVRMVEQALTAIEALTGTRPPEEKLWHSLRTRAKKATLSQKFASWAWKGLHDSHKIGDFWRRGSGYEERAPCAQCNAPTESLDHILLECRMTNQMLVWDTVKRIWSKTGKEWRDISVGLILGIGLAEIKKDNGKKDVGLTRLFQILISEAAYLIWLLRCEWRLGREANTARVHTTREVLSRLRLTIERRIRTDRILTQQRAHGKKALSSQLVTRTWQFVTADRDNANPRISFEEVLVGSAVDERSPGRNR